MPDAQYSSAWQQLMDPQGFYAPYGPTTAERRHRFFMFEATAGCCRWNGPSWPFSTTHTLMGLANLLNNYAQSFVTKDHYFTVLKNYALTHYRNGLPYVAEAHQPDSNSWLYDGFNHSEHYNHSSYNDLVISGLIGLRPRGDNTFVVNPLVPTSWNYFLLENVLYHGHLMTILWDRDGSRYGRGAGLRIFQDGVEIASSATLTRLQVAMAAPLPLNKPPRFNNLAANPARTGFPAPIASYTNVDDNGWEAMDGDIWYDDIPDSRWTAYTSPNATDWFGINFGTARTISEVRLYIYDDGGGVRAPASYNVQYWNGSAWVDAAGQVKTPAVPAGADRNVVRFNAVSTSQVRIVFTHAAGSKAGVTEFEVWDGVHNPTPTPTATARPVPQGPFGGTNRTIANGSVIQAEDYDVGGANVAYSDTTAGNLSTVYRTEDVDIEGTTDVGGGYNVDWTAAGEWLEYTVNATAGTYTITARVASAAAAPADFRVLLDGVVLGTFATSATGGWQTWADLSISGVAITGGSNRVLRVEVVNGADCNLNYIRFASSATPTPTARLTATATATTRVTPTATATTRATPTATTRPRPTPTVPAGCAIGATCEAETALLGGGVVASTLHAGYTGSGFADYQGNGTGYVEWTVSVPSAGTYSLGFRYANGGTGDRPMAIAVNGTTVVSSLSFPVTGWTTWTVRSQSVTLPAGAVRIRATELPNGPNVDNLVVTGGATPTPTTPPRATATATPTPRATPTAGGTAAWAPNVAYVIGNLATYGGATYRCTQAHTSQIGWEPPNAPALWSLQ
jgi:hypothetical protein